MKPKLFVDMDSTITKSIKAFCQTYNQLYKYKPNFTLADWTKVNKWNFSDQCPLLEDTLAIENIFASKHFFRKLEFMPNAKKVLYELHKDFQIIVVSIGTHLNLSRKAMWLYQNMGFVKDIILLHNSDKDINKRVVNMENGIFIDDVASNLESSNAATKICYGKEYPWNNSWKGLKCIDWECVDSTLQIFK